MTRLKTQLVKPEVRLIPRAFGGLLAGLEAGPVLSWGPLDVVSLRLVPGTAPGPREQFATPEEHLKLVEVPTYGTVVLRNTSTDDRLLVPMHVGFFQPGAQNHATSRALVLEAGETLQVKDCFCVQAARSISAVLARSTCRSAAISARHTGRMCFSRWCRIVRSLTPNSSAIAVSGQCRR